jgi:hypothetical protein
MIRFSTLFRAMDYPDWLADGEARAQAVQWCNQMHVSKVYLETFRKNITASREDLQAAIDCFAEAGIATAGCVTTCGFGKRATDWDLLPCFTDPDNQAALGPVFRYAAELFDEIMIDDFLFHCCACEDCERAKGSRSWSQFRRDLMLKLSREQILAPAREVNPGVRIIIKFPQWYDLLHERGYDVARQSEAFDRIWVGTETRDPYRPDDGLPRVPQYEAYYIMRWLNDLGGDKCGGGWFDTYRTSPNTYIEQAVQTILGGAEEAVLFCYDSLHNKSGPECAAAFCAELPGVEDLSRHLEGTSPMGVSAPKGPNSEAGDQRYVFDYVGWLGVPLLPRGFVDVEASSVFLARHALADPELTVKLDQFHRRRTPVVMTDGLAGELPDHLVQADNVRILPVGGDVRSLPDLPPETIVDLRTHLLGPWELSLAAPARVGMYLRDDGTVVLANFADQPAQVDLQAADAAYQPVLTIPKDAVCVSSGAQPGWAGTLPPRTTVVLRRS